MKRGNKNADSCDFSCCALSRPPFKMPDAIMAAFLLPIYDSIENGVADLADPMLKDRIAELKATRNQARADAERAESALDRLGPTIRRSQNVCQNGPQVHAKACC